MNIFGELSLILVIAAIVAAMMRLLKQPLIIGHILTGLLVGPYVLDILQSKETLQIFAQLGVAFLLFIVGLNLKPDVVREVGKISIITGVGQILFTTVIGVGLCVLLGFSFIESLYISIALTFSSTIIIMKLLSDKGDLEKLYSKIAIGFLLVQDIVAAFMLIVFSPTFQTGSTQNAVLFLVLKGSIFAIILVWTALYILPHLTRFAARSQAFLLLFTAAWGLGLSALFYYSGFSLEIGALIAGVMLSSTPYQSAMSAKLRTLRDFFIIVFFIILGSQLVFGDIQRLWIPAIILSLFVLIGNPIIVFLLMTLLKYNKKTSFLSGLTVAQISEFSLLIILLGVQNHILKEEILVLVTLVGLITIAGSTYLIVYAEKIYALISPLLNFYHPFHTSIQRGAQSQYENVLFGYNRVGFDFLEIFRKNKKTSLIVDFNPVTIAQLKSSGIQCMYGDAEDSDFLDDLNLRKVKIMVSTIPDFAANLLLLKKIRACNKNAIVFVLSLAIDDSFQLYTEGADYVIMPHFLGGHYASLLLMEAQFKKRTLQGIRTRHIHYLEQRKKLGHEHPHHTSID